MEVNNFALRLNRLFEEKKKPDGKQYSQTDVLEGTHGALTRVYLWKLRNAHALNPSLQVIRSLADFFGVDPSYFFENDAPGETSNANLAREISARVSTLNLQEQQTVLFMIEAIQKAQRLKEDAPPKVRKGAKKQEGE